MPNCPDCCVEVIPYGYADSVSSTCCTGVKCPKCRTKWPTEQEFLQYVQLYQENPAEPSGLCRCCGQDVQHRKDSVWHRAGLRDPNACPTCRSCPTCGAHVLLPRSAERRVVCQVCGASWSDASEFEGELVASAWTLGLDLEH